MLGVLVLVSAALLGPAFAQTPAALTCVTPATGDLAGLWESRATSKGGIGHAMEFRADGSFVEAATFIVNTFYRATGNRVALLETSGPGAAEDPYGEFRLDGNVLVHTAPDGTTLNKDRLGKPPMANAPLVGAWRYRHYTGATAYERYTDDGRMLFRLPMTGAKGCFAVKGQTLVLTRPGQQDTSTSFERRADDLVLRDAGKELVYGREPAGAWYDLEHIDVKLPR